MLRQYYTRSYQTASYQYTRSTMCYASTQARATRIRVGITVSTCLLQRIPREIHSLVAQYTPKSIEKTKKMSAICTQLASTSSSKHVTNKPAKALTAAAPSPDLRNQRQTGSFTVPFVPGARVFRFDFARYYVASTRFCSRVGPTGAVW